MKKNQIFKSISLEVEYNGKTYELYAIKPAQKRFKNIIEGGREFDVLVRDEVSGDLVLLYSFVTDASSLDEVAEMIREGCGEDLAEYEETMKKYDMMATVFDAVVDELIVDEPAEDKDDAETNNDTEGDNDDSECCEDCVWSFSCECDDETLDALLKLAKILDEE